VREKIVTSLTPTTYRFRRVEPVVFICGGQASNPRDTLRHFLVHEHPSINVFYAEQVWEVISSTPGLGALKMESDLAELSDLVIIIVESPGTFAELGAFSHVEALRKKLLPIVDIQYRGSNSFINTGPIKWIDQESNFRPTIWVPLDSILLCAKEIEKRIQAIPPQPKASRVSNLTVNRKLLLFFVCDLVGVIAPATVETIEYFVERIISRSTAGSLDVPMLVGLAEAMGLLRKEVVNVTGVGQQTYFSPRSAEALGHPFHKIKWVDLSSLRSEYVYKLQLIPQALEVMREVNSRI
jgi:hypothetical protein